MPTPRGPQEENLEKNSLIFVCATPMGRPRRKVDDPPFIRREDLATCRLILKDIYQVNCEKRDCHLRIEGDMTKGPASGPWRCECRRELAKPLSRPSLRVSRAVSRPPAASSGVERRRASVSVTSFTPQRLFRAATTRVIHSPLGDPSSRETPLRFITFTSSFFLVVRRKSGEKCHEANATNRFAIPSGPPVGVGVHLGGGASCNVHGAECLRCYCPRREHRKISNSLTFRSGFQKSNRGRVGVREWGRVAVAANETQMYTLHRV